VPQKLKSLEEKILNGLKLDIPYARKINHQKMNELRTKGEWESAAVLVLIGFSELQSPALLLTRRTQKVETHKGQMAFPGGSVDSQDENALATALRETEEEVGILKESIKVIGELPPIWIPASHFLVNPVIGTLKDPTNTVNLKLNRDEIEEALWIPLDVLKNPEIYREESISYEDQIYPLPVFQVNNAKIWGATATMIKNLLDRLEQVA